MLAWMLERRWSRLLNFFITLGTSAARMCRSEKSVSLYWAQVKILKIKKIKYVILPEMKNKRKKMDEKKMKEKK